MSNLPNSVQDSNQNNSYSAENISVLEGLEAVRKRPGMYIGNTSSEGLNRCFGEIIDNSVDEFMANEASTIKVILNADGSCLVADDGRGIPTGIHPKTGKSTLETIMTVLHAGGKFDQNNYKFSGGLHGVGASVVNALSEITKVWVLRNSQISFLSFSKGKTIGNIQNFEENDGLQKFPELEEAKIWENSGTITYFKPDASIFETVDFDRKSLLEYLRNNAYLNKGLKIIFVDKIAQKTEELCFPKGIYTYLEKISEGENLLTPIIHSEFKENNFQLEMALSWSEDFKEKLLAFTNGIINPEGGTHVTGLKSALAKLINGYMIAKNLGKKEEKFTSDDLKEGIRVILSIKMVDPQFTSQSKVKLGSTIARTLTEKVVTEKFGTFLEENPKIAQTIIQKAQLAMKARLAAKAAREAVQRKNPLDSLSLPGKLADCTEKDPEKSEIYIVEGDSAGGSAKQGRDRYTQAILPLRGKVLNTEKATLDRIMNYEGIKNMIMAFGCGIGEKFDKEKLRYHKIILMTDADVDGSHITTLLLTFFYRYMPVLIEEGYIYMARPPLYKIAVGKKFEEYVYSDSEKDALVRKIIGEGDVEILVNSDEIQEKNEETQITKPKKKIEIQRYKGLGEMNPEQLWETTMNPKTRLLWQVTIGEAQIANSIFEDLMGSDVEPRRKFIEENAMFVEDIDLV
jgi:DNA gyrase subunit B